MNTSTSIDLDYHVLPCGCCFIVSSKGLPICHSADPITDTALFLKEAGVADERTIKMRLEGSNVGISFSLGDAIDTSESEPNPSAEPENGPWSRVD